MDDKDVVELVSKAIAAADEAKRAEAAKVAEIEAKLVAARAEGKQEGIKEVEARIPAYKGGFATKEVTKLGLKDDDMKAFAYWLRTGDETAVRAALQEGTATEGGYLVPNDFYAQIVEKRYAASWVRQSGVRVIQTGMDVIDIPIESSSAAKFVTVGEEVAYDEAEPTFNNAQVSVYKWTKLVKISEELLADDRTDINGFLQRQIATGQALTEGYYVAVGTGSSQPRGVTGSNSDQVTYFDFASAGEMEGSELSNMFYKLPAGYRSGAVWVSKVDVEGYVRGLSQTGYWTWGVPVQPGLPIGTFIGGARYFNEDGMTGLTSGVPTTTSSHIFLGNMDYYAFVENGGLVVSRNPYLYQGTGQVGIFCKFRFGGIPMQGEAFVVGSQP